MGRAAPLILAALCAVCWHSPSPNSLSTMALAPAVFGVWGLWACLAVFPLSLSSDSFCSSLTHELNHGPLLFLSLPLFSSHSVILQTFFSRICFLCIYIISNPPSPTSASSASPHRLLPHVSTLRRRVRSRPSTIPNDLRSDDRSLRPVAGCPACAASWYARAGLICPLSGSMLIVPGLQGQRRDPALEADPRSDPFHTQAVF